VNALTTRATAEECLAGGATIFIAPNEYVEVAVRGDDVVLWGDRATT
jgi:hypothetical protein